jgi:hypothetical protein
MKLKMLGTLALALCMAPGFAFAAVTDVDDDSNPAAELDLYEIYDIIYDLDGTSAEHDATTAGVGTTLRSDGLELDPDELFTFFSGTFTFRARYASNTQEFGYYDPVDNSQTTLQVVTGTNNVVLDDSEAALASTTELFNPTANPFGFYDRSPHNGTQVWFSEAAENSDALDHMVAYWAMDSDGNVSTDRFIIAFEDSGNGSDRDFNDLVIEIVMDPVPEPATAGLLLLGLGGMAIRRRFMA